MPLRRLIDQWPLLRQPKEGDLLGLGRAVTSPKTRELRPRTADAQQVVPSICPYCAVGCGQLVYVSGGEVTQIEGDPASPISRGRLCPKGAASKGLHDGPWREYKAKSRRPYSTHWDALTLDDAMDMIADRIIDARASDWDQKNRRTMSIANLGGATLDNEENYLIKKLCMALGIVQVENQARI